MTSPAAEAYACPACDATPVPQAFRWGSGMGVHRCEGCSLMFARPTPTPAQLEAFYQGFLYRRPARRRLAALLEERKRELISWFGWSRAPSGNAGRTYLDHGGGTGVAYAAAKELGLDCWFAEMDEQAIAFVAETFGLPGDRLVGSLADFPGRFDYILSDNVVEHVPDPVALLRQLSECLRPGGVLVVKTPHAASTDTYFYPRVWLSYAKKVARHNGWQRAASMLVRDPVWACDPPRHLYSFTQEALAHMARKAGLAPAQFSIETYQVPLLKNTYTERVLRRRRGALGNLARVALMPVLPAELASKAVQRLYRRRGWLSPGGLVLRVRREAAPAR